LLIRRTRIYGILGLFDSTHDHDIADVIHTLSLEATFIPPALSFLEHLSNQIRIANLFRQIGGERDCTLPFVIMITHLTTTHHHADTTTVLQPSRGYRRLVLGGCPTPGGVGDDGSRSIGRSPFQDRTPTKIDVLSEKKKPTSSTTTTSTFRHPSVVLPDHRKRGHTIGTSSHHHHHHHPLPTLSVGGRSYLPSSLLYRRPNNQSTTRFLVSTAAATTKPLTMTSMERSLTDFVATLATRQKEDDREGTTSCCMPQHWVEAQLEHLVYRRAVADHEWMSFHCPPHADPSIVDGGRMEEIVRSYSFTHTAKDIVPMIGDRTIVQSLLLFDDGYDRGRSLDHPRRVRLVTLLIEFLYCQQVIGFRSMREFKTQVTALSMGPKSSQTDPPTSTPIASPIVTSCSDRGIVDGDKIIHQLSVLKAGGYWKYLSSSGGDGIELGHYSDVEDNTDGTNHQSYNSNNEAKENSRPVFGNLHNDGGSRGIRGGNRTWRRRNRTMTNPSRYEPDNDDDDDDDEDEQYGNDDDDDNTSSIDSDNHTTRSTAASTFLAGCVLSGTSTVHCTNGFFVTKVTGDGWLCARAVPLESDSCTTSTCADSIPTYLLRLPWKVARLGRDGMSINGIDLRQRRDNGALEPCNTTSLVAERWDDCSPLRGTIHL
jgi:hypothetical protein